MQTAEQIRNEITARAAAEPDYRARLLSGPREAIEEVTGSAMPENFSVRIHEETFETFHLVLPQPTRLSDSQLESVSGSAMLSTPGSLPNW